MTFEMSYFSNFRCLPHVYVFLTCNLLRSLLYIVLK